MIQTTRDSILLSPTEVAEYLGVTPRRVYALVHDGRLQAIRSGRRLLIDRAEVDARSSSGHSVGRPFSPRRAWAIILLASGIDPRGIDAPTKSRLRRLVRERDLWSLRGKLVRRAERRPLRAHSSDVRRLESEHDAVLTGARAADSVGLVLVAPDAALELYVDAATADRLVARYRLASSPDPNVVLRVVADDVRAWLPWSIAPMPAVALDIAESPDARSQDVARAALARR